MPICENEYVTAYLEAQKRLRNGEAQGFCWECMKWRFNDQCEHKKETAYEFNLMKRMQARAGDETT